MKAVSVYGSSKSKKFVVHWYVSQGYGHLVHRLSYMHRTPVADFLKCVNNARFYDRVMAEPDVEWVQRCMERTKGFNRFSAVGLLANSRYKGHLRSLGEYIEGKAARRRLRSRVKCPRCGVFMTPSGCVMAIHALLADAVILSWAAIAVYEASLKLRESAG